MPISPPRISRMVWPSGSSLVTLTISVCPAVPSAVSLDSTVIQHLTVRDLAGLGIICRMARAVTDFAAAAFANHADRLAAIDVERDAIHIP